MSQPMPNSRPQSKSTEIAAGSKVKGEVSGSTELHVEGEVDGKILLENGVVIGRSGRVKGEIQARTVSVSGKVVGNVRGLESVSILAEGSLQGDVVSPRMSIADGAFFKGKVEMTGDKSFGEGGQGGS